MSSAEPAIPAPVQFEGVNPILRVESLEKSIEHYVRVLGFKLAWQTPQFACVAREKCSLFLCEGDQGHRGTWVWIGVTDAAALLAEYRRSGAKVRHQPTNYPWAYEMQVEDIDGNVLRLGSEPKQGQPRGEWFDMNGQCWTPMPDGGWRRLG
jgi:catechol 2,3-dioxygenase-like lactoylglutathione lyase family enzyme